jgi:hypothetical protein
MFVVQVQGDDTFLPREELVRQCGLSKSWAVHVFDENSHLPVAVATMRCVHSIDALSKLIFERPLDSWIVSAGQQPAEWYDPKVGDSAAVRAVFL